MFIYFYLPIFVIFVQKIAKIAPSLNYCDQADTVIWNNFVIFVVKIQWAI